MQSVSSRIWTRVTVSISYDDNHYTTVNISRVEFELVYYVGAVQLISLYATETPSENACYHIFFITILCWLNFIIYCLIFRVAVLPEDDLNNVLHCGNNGK